MHQAVSGHDWVLLLDRSGLPLFRWKCSRCLSVVQASKRPRRAHRIQVSPSRDGMSCGEVIASNILRM